MSWKKGDRVTVHGDYPIVAANGGNPLVMTIVHLFGYGTQAMVEGEDNGIGMLINVPLTDLKKVEP